MGVLNVTPDSFSDGGRFFSIERALERAEEMVAEGADVLDIGGESTRPGGEAVDVKEELRRTLPVIERLAAKLNVPLSIDTTKSEVARAAFQAGAEIVNDISGLRFDPMLADEAAQAGAGLVLMHSRGTPDELHKLEPVADIMGEVMTDFKRAITEAEARGVGRASIVLDPGIGFGKSFEQNLALLARLDVLVREFAEFPFLVGTSRKSFIGRILDGAAVTERIYGTMATVTSAVLRGASIVRVHDVRAAVETVRVAEAIRRATKV